MNDNLSVFLFASFYREVVGNMKRFKTDRVLRNIPKMRNVIHIGI